jgi:hypothetical protein
MHPYELSTEAKQKIKAEMEYRETVERELVLSRPKDSWKRKISDFFSHAFTVAVLGGFLIAVFQFSQWAIQDKLTRKGQLQEKQYTLLATFSDQFDQYMVLLYNLRMQQIYFTECATNRNKTDFLGRSKAEVLPIYEELVKEILQHPRGEAVLVSVRALFHSQQVNNQLDTLDDEVLKLQHGGPDDGKLTEKQIMGMDKDIENQVRRLAIAMRQEMDERN